MDCSSCFVNHINIYIYNSFFVKNILKNVKHVIKEIKGVVYVFRMCEFSLYSDVR